jgi:hypothetical protein
MAESPARKNNEFCCAGLEGRPACDSDRRVTVNNIQVILVCGRPSDRLPRHKVQPEARHARYSKIRNPYVVGHFCGRESNSQILCRSLDLLVWCFQK